MACRQHDTQIVSSRSIDTREALAQFGPGNHVAADLKSVSLASMRIDVQDWPISGNAAVGQSPQAAEKVSAPAAGLGFDPALMKKIIVQKLHSAHVIGASAVQDVYAVERHARGEKHHGANKSWALRASRRKRQRQGRAPD